MNPFEGDPNVPRVQEILDEFAPLDESVAEFAELFTRITEDPKTADLVRGAEIMEGIARMLREMAFHIGLEDKDDDQ